MPGQGSGSRKGSPNKTTLQVREFLERIKRGVGGEKAAIVWAKGNQDIFWPLYFQKALPNMHAVKGEIEGGGTQIINIWQVIAQQAPGLLQPIAPRQLPATGGQDRETEAAVIDIDFEEEE